MKELNISNFDATLNETKGIVLVDFWASWCGPCRMLAPILEELDNETEDLTVCKVNVDENPALADRYAIEAIPTIIFFRDGKQVLRKTGVYPKDGLQLLLRDARK